MRMKILDLFAGIGGFSLAAHWLGWETAAFVEWEDFNKKVLAKNFPGVPIYSDIREFNGKEYEGRIEIITGGFPCQPFSTAGKRDGANDERYLWPEMLRVIREVKPAFVIGENVAGILSMDDGNIFEQVCASLESEGYAVQAFVIPACALGAPHRRDRVWIIANANQHRTSDKHTGGNESKGKKERVQERHKMERVKLTDSPHGQITSNSDKKRLQVTGEQEREEVETSKGAGVQYTVKGFGCTDSDTDHSSPQRQQRNGGQVLPKPEPEGLNLSHEWDRPWYEVATRLCGVDDGIPGRVDRFRAKRLKSLGNAIVPQVAYQIMKGINEAYHLQN